MWVTRVKIRHDCTIGNRCRKYGCTAYALSIAHWKEGRKDFTSQRHVIEGPPESVKSFLGDLKRDQRIEEVEISENVVFMIEARTTERIPSSYFDPRIFYVKPVFVNKDGYEFWEMACADRELLMRFINGLKMEKNTEVEVEKIHDVPLQDVHFPHILPKLSRQQARAYELAVENGYYEFPRKTTLSKLAKLMTVAVSTYQEHLRLAESKILPSFRIK